MVIQYRSRPDWSAGVDFGRSSAWIDLSDDPEVAGAVETLRKEVGLPRGITGNARIRITGYLDGGKMIPSKISYATRNDKDTYTIILERAAPEGTDQITVYTDTVRDYCFVEELEVRHDGIEYSNLLELLRDRKGANQGIVYSLTDMFLFDAAVIGPEVDGRLQTEFTILSAVRCNPLLGAVNTLRSVYIYSFFLGCLVLAVILLIIRKNLTRPLAVLDAHMAGDFLPQLKRTPKWRESLAIEAHFQNWQRSARNCWISRRNWKTPAIACVKLWNMPARRRKSDAG